MPTHIRWFLWLCLVAVAYSAGSMLIFVYFTNFDVLYAPIPQAERVQIVHQTVVITLATTATWSGVDLILIACTVLGRWNWARWTYAGLFVVHRVAPFAIAAAYHQLGHKVGTYFSAENWSDPLTYVSTILTLAAIWFVFTGDAKAWFASRTTAPA